MLINCHWVAGSFKGKGYGKQILAEYEKDAKGMNGVVVMVGNKKKLFFKQGYEVCDTASPYFELLVKQFDEKAKLPQFKPSAKLGKIEGLRGIDIFYTAQCPFTVTYIDLIKPMINSADIPHTYTSDCK